MGYSKLRSAGKLNHVKSMSLKGTTMYSDSARSDERPLGKKKYLRPQMCAAGVCVCVCVCVFLCLTGRGKKNYVNVNAGCF